MGRILIDTNEVRDLARGLRSDAGAIGDLNLRIVADWARTPIPPLKFVDFVGLSGRSVVTQAQIAVLVTQLRGAAAALHVHAVAVDVADSDAWRSVSPFVRAGRWTLVGGVVGWPTFLSQMITGALRETGSRAAIVQTDIRALGERSIAVGNYLLELLGPPVAIRPNDLGSMCFPRSDSLADLMTNIEKIDQMKKGSIAVLEPKPGHFILMLPGVEDLFDANTPSGRDLVNAKYGRFALSDPYSEAAKKVLMDLPPGSQVMIMGHSYGGITAMNLGVDRELGNHVNITHIIAAGSGVREKLLLVPTSTRVVMLENGADAVRGTIANMAPTAVRYGAGLATIEDALNPLHKIDDFWQQDTGPSSLETASGHHYRTYAERLRLTEQNSDILTDARTNYLVESQPLTARIIYMEQAPSGQ